MQRFKTSMQSSFRHLSIQNSNLFSKIRNSTLSASKYSDFFQNYRHFFSSVLTYAVWRRYRTSNLCSFQHKYFPRYTSDYHFASIKNVKRLTKQKHFAVIPDNVQVLNS